MNNRNILPTMLGTLIFLLLFLFPSFAWYSGYADWQYRKEITIQENSGNTLTDYQVLLTIDTQSLINEGKMNSDCSDMRFTYYDGSSEQEIPYWIESGCGTTETKVWIKVPSIPANGQATVYMYYGNPSAGSESNASETFDFYDDFEGTGNLNGQRGWQACGDINAELQGDGTVKVTASSDGVKIVNSKDVPSDNIIVEYRGRFPTFPQSVGYGDAGVVWKSDYLTSGSADLAFYYRSGYDTALANNFETMRHTDMPGDDGTEKDYDTSKPFSMDTNYHVYKIIWTSPTVKVFIDTTQLKERTFETIPSGNKVGLFIHEHEGAEFYFDWLRVRKYTSPEPTYTVGEEETGNITNLAPQITIYSPQNTTYYTTQITANFTVIDDNSTTFHVKAFLNGNTIYDNSAYANNTEVTIDLQSYITSDGSYNFTVWANDTDENPQASTESVIFTVETYPKYSNETVTPESPITYGENVTFSIIWEDELNNIASVWIEHNFTDTMANYTMANESGTFTHTFVKPPAGTFAYRMCAQDDYGLTNCTEWKNYTVNPAPSGLTISSSAGWNLIKNEQTTISASAVVPVELLKINDVEVSNPYTFVPDVGFYDVYAQIVDKRNYTPWNMTKTLVVNSLFSCTDSDTFAFEKNISVTSNIVVLDFSQMIELKYVKEDLSDVKVVTNVSEVWKNGKKLVVNATGLNKITVRFGNYYANISYEEKAIPSGAQNVNVTTYTQINPLAIVSLKDELTNEYLYPPGSETFGIIACSYGENIFRIENSTTRFLVASKDYITKVGIRVKYSADAYYTRLRYFDTENINYISVDMFVADAYKVALDRIDLIMAD
ncbi:MAG: hypothetical protein DRJ64_06305, partial [Thermoprotei archaeon]